jgi:hydroxymethylbilane synthase
LARTGLQRINLDDRITEVLPTTWADGATVAMVPAVGAAVIGVQARTADEPVMRLLDEINDPDTARHITAERTMLHMLRGHCNSPIAGHAHHGGRAIVAVRDGVQPRRFPVGPLARLRTDRRPGIVGRVSGR